MSFCSFAEGGAMFDTTPIENMFLLEYMPMAPEGYVRVYLYARMLSLHPELDGSLEKLAAALHMDEDAVYDAFTYWERQGLVKRVADRPPAYAILPLRAGTVNEMDDSYYKYRDFNSSLQAMFTKDRVIQPHESAMAVDWLTILGFDQDAVLRMVKHEIERSRSKSPDPRALFKRVDKKAAQWSERGIHTLEEVEKAIAGEDGVYDMASAVLRQFQLRRQPTLDELDCARRWMTQWNLTQEQVLQACAETTKTNRPSFAYLDAVLRSRLEGEGESRDELVAVLRELVGPGVQPTPDQEKSYAMLREAGFEPETIRLAAVQCHRKRKTSFDDLEWMLAKWREKGLYTAREAGAYVEQMQKTRARVRGVFERCGVERRLSQEDLDRYLAWREQFDDAVIDFAADCARGMDNPTIYMRRLLDGWQQDGVRTVDQAKERHAAHQAARGAAYKGSATAVNPALDYDQRTYSDDDFGDDFYYNDMGRNESEEGEA